MAKRFEKASIIVSIYDNIEFLEAVLNSLKSQTVQDFEVIISEDAAHASVKQFLENYKYEGEISHLSHPDVGWTKNIALNKAIRHAKYDYLILIDGDCVLHSRFVEFHMKKAEEEKILAGKRIKLDLETSLAVLSGELQVKDLNSYILKNFFSLKPRGAKFVEEGVFVGDRLLWGWIPRMRKMRQLKGCNMSFSKKAIYAINGFDEDYNKPAIGEDIDLTWRFIKAGYSLKSMRNLAVQYHLYHKENWNDQAENQQQMERNIKSNTWYCINGINKS